MLDVPPGANHLPRRGRPCKATVVPPVVAIPPQLAVVHDRVDKAITAGERMLDVPPVTYFLPRAAERPTKGGVVSPVVTKPHQIVVGHDRVDTAITAGEHMLDVPPGANHLPRRGRPIKGTVAPPVVKATGNMPRFPQ